MRNKCDTGPREDTLTLFYRTCRGVSNGRDRPSTAVQGQLLLDAQTSLLSPRTLYPIKNDAAEMSRARAYTWNSHRPMEPRSSGIELCAGRDGEFSLNAFSS